MLETLKSAAKMAGLQCKDGTATAEGGKVLPIAVIQHGPHNVLGIPHEGNSVVLAYIIEFGKEDAEMLARQPPEIQSRLMAILRREMLEGRTGFAFLLDHKKGDTLRQIKIEQRWVAESDNAAQVQRLVDAVQEIVTVGVRCTDVLAHAFGSIKVNTSAEALPDHMFI